MQQNLTRKQVIIIRFFSVTGMTGQNQDNWPNFFCQGTFFEVFGKGVARGSGPPPYQNLFLIFRLNLEQIFKNRLTLGAFRPQRLLIFKIGDLKFPDLAK